MDFWNIFDDVLGPLNLIDRAEGLVSAIRFGDYRKAGQKGAAGIPVEVLRSVVGANTARFALLQAGNHSLAEVEKLLRRYGIPIFGRTHDSEKVYFSVKKRQANWAEYVMLNAGVELANPTFDRRNPGYVGRHGPGWMPQPWSEKERRPEVTRSGTPAAAAGKPSQLGRVSSWLDRLLED